MGCLYPVVSHKGGGKMKWVKKDSGFLLSFFINLLFNLEWAIPALICFVLVSLQKSVHKKTGASDYITEEGVHISHASDRFTHTTQTRRKLQTNQNGKK